MQDFSFMFHSTAFDGDISGWDTSSATNMNAMFALNEEFDQTLHWDVSNVRSTTRPHSSSLRLTDRVLGTTNGLYILPYYKFSRKGA